MMVRALRPSVEALEGRQLLARLPIASLRLSHVGLELLRAGVIRAPEHAARSPQSVQFHRLAPPPHASAHAVGTPHWTAGDILVAPVAVPIFMVAGLFHKGI